MVDVEVISLPSGHVAALEFNMNECELLVMTNQPDDPRTYTLLDVTRKDFASYLADPASLESKLEQLPFESAIPNHWEGNI